MWKYIIITIYIPKHPSVMEKWMMALNHRCLPFHLQKELQRLWDGFTIASCMPLVFPLLIFWKDSVLFIWPLSKAVYWPLWIRCCMGSVLHFLNDRFPVKHTQKIKIHYTELIWSKENVTRILYTVSDELMMLLAFGMTHHLGGGVVNRQTKILKGYSFRKKNKHSCALLWSYKSN